MLGVEGVYNHLNFIGSEYFRDPYEAEDRLRDVWSLIYGSVRATLVNDDPDSRMKELRELTHDYLDTPTLHSLQLRNLLIQNLFNAAYPIPKGINLPDKAILPTLVIALVLFWVFPDLADLFQNIFRVAIVGFIIWLLFTYRRRRLIDHLRQELQASQFNDQIVRAQLEKLDARRHRLPTLIFSLIDQSPRRFRSQRWRAMSPLCRQSNGEPAYR